MAVINNGRRFVGAFSIWADDIDNRRAQQGKIGGTSRSPEHGPM
jgi:hypothetical protein